MSAEAGQSATRETLNMHTLLSGKKAPQMCVIAIYSVEMHLSHLLNNGLNTEWII